MATTQTDAQICALKELLMAKQAYHRSLNEFLNTLPEKVRDDRVVFMIQHMPDIDPRETSEKTLQHVMELAYGHSAALAAVPTAFAQQVAALDPPFEGKRRAQSRKIDASTLALIYEFVVEECRNGCTSARDARTFITKKHPEWVDKNGPVPGYYLGQYLETLNFPAIRENSKDLGTLSAV